jgi:hypothetical protein
MAHYVKNKSLQFIFTKIYFLIVVIVLQPGNYSYGQVATKSNVNDIRSSSIFILKNENDIRDEKESRKLLNNPKKLDDYNQSIRTVSELNEDFTRAVKAVWTFSKMDTTARYTKDVDEKSKEAYAVYFKIIKVQIVEEQAGFSKPGVQRTVEVDPPYINVVLGKFRNGKEKEVYADIGIPVTSKFPDFYHAVSLIQNHLEAVEEGRWKKLACLGCVPDLYRVLADKNSNQLSKLTLLVDKKYLTGNVTENNFSKFYPYKFKIVETKDIDSMLVNKEKGCAYLAPTIILNELVTMPLWNIFHVLRTEDGELIGYDKGVLTGRKTTEILLTDQAIVKIVSMKE